MKNIFKTILALCAVAGIFSSCNKEMKYADNVTASKSEIAFDGMAPQNVKITVTADGDWYIYSPSWLTANPSHGSGNTEVTLSAKKNVDNYNELQAPRLGELAVCGQSKYFPIAVSQNGESGLDATKTFKKITKMEEFQAGYAYLITATVDGTINACMPCAAETDVASSYAYMYPTTVKADEDGSITQDNASLCFYLDAVEGGYVIRQAKGNYLYMSAGYANFYTISSKDKASVWTLAFDEKGNAILTNTSAADRVLTYETKSYKNFSAINGDIASNYMLPVLYKDSAKPSDEVLSVAATTYVTAATTTVSLAVKSNKTWKVRCHDEWVSSFTKEGSGDGVIELTFDANTGANRTASIQIIGETTNVTVSLVQSAPLTTIEALNAWSKLGAAKYEITLNESYVSFVSGNNVFLEDATGAILLYQKSHGLTAGMKINGKVSGSVTLYNGLPELTSIDVTAATVDQTETYPCTTITIEDLNKNFDKYVSCRVKLVDVTVDKGVAARKDSGTLSQNGQTITVYAQAAAVLTEGAKGTVIVYPTVNGDKKMAGFWQTSDFTPAE